MDSPQWKKCFDCDIEAIAVCTRLFCKTFAQWTSAISGEGTSASILLVVDHKMCVIKPWKMEGSDSYWFGVWFEVDCIAKQKKIWWEENPKNPLLKISEILPMCKWWLCSEMSSMQRWRNLGEKNEINWSKLTLNPRLTLTSTRKWVGEPDYQN